MDDFFIRVMQMGEVICMDVVGYDLYGWLVVHSMVVSRSTLTMNKHDTEWVWTVQVARKTDTLKGYTKRNSIFQLTSYFAVHFQSPSTVSFLNCQVSELLDFSISELPST